MFSCMIIRVTKKSAASVFSCTIICVIKKIYCLSVLLYDNMCYIENLLPQCFPVRYFLSYIRQSTSSVFSCMIIRVTKKSAASVFSCTIICVIKKIYCLSVLLYDNMCYKENLLPQCFPVR